MKLSVIIPTLNEAQHLDRLISSVQDIDATEKEIIIVDGGSDDGTAEKVAALSRQHSNIRLVENPGRYVSQGFNQAFQVARGQFISLIGAHAIYPKNYFSTCIAHIETGSCEVAGGFLQHRGNGVIGKAIAHCMGSQFGVGNTEFRTAPRQGYVDSVAFAVYDRRVFDRAGLFDEHLVRNQDDEFHYRLNQCGHRILMLPQLETVYFVRDSIPKLFSQYYQYGYYKPLVFKKVRNSIRLRHLAPAGFVLYLVSLPIALWQPIWLAPLLLYLALDIRFSLAANIPFSSRLAALSVYPTLHLAYGAGFIRGFFEWIICRKK